VNASIEVVSLGEAVKPTRPRVKPSDYPELPFIGMEHIEAHSMKLLGTVPAKTMKSSAVHFKPGDVLYGRLRPYLNKVYRPSFEGLCSAEFIVLPENNRVDGAYLQYFLNSGPFVRYATHLNAGDRPRVDFDQLAAYKIPLPGIDDQRRVVAEIEKQFSRVDEAVTNLSRIKANLARYCRAQIAAVCPRLGARLSTGWRWARLPNLGELARGKSKHRPRSDPKLYGGPYPFIQTGDVRASMGRIRSYSQTYSQLGLAQSRLWPKGTLCITIAANIAETGILEIEACFPDSVVGFCVEGNPVLAKYVEFYLRSIKDRLDRLAPATAQKNINLAILEKVEIPVPPEKILRRLVATIESSLSIAEQVSAEVAASLLRAIKLKEAHLAKAFLAR